MALTSFGKKISIMLIENSMTQKQLAEQLGVSLQHLNGLLHGSPALELQEEIEEWYEQQQQKKLKGE